MDVATALTAAQTLFATLQCAEVRKLCSICNYEYELQKLLDTVKIIKNCLLDADSKSQELTKEGKNRVENLKDAVYEADDLLDEFNTIAHQLKRMPGGKIFKKVRRFFSSSNQLVFAVNMSKDIKKLREKLDSLAKNHSDFGFSELYKPVKSREETCSYVYEQSIIGRDADKEAIVDLLLKDDSENISFVTIVGIGGLGKTALAQLVYNDLRIKEAFQKLYWVCVSENFSMKDILGKMHSELEINKFEDLYLKIREQIEGERYLLVLDDVWSENSKEWDVLKDFLILGKKGSRILITSRSKKVAGAIGSYPIHELEGLSKEDSWELFKKISLGHREDEAVTSLVRIGKDIVIKCANVPLSIRVVASLLRGQDITVWQSYRRIDFAKMREDEDDLMPTLMFSYYHLDPALKSCFSFCSVFPQDYCIDKQELISLWSAHGYLVPSGTDNSMEDVGERYFLILLHRCFFQDIERNYSGGVKSVKMHDLIHDLARKIAGKESLTWTASSTHEAEGKVRHLFVGASNEYLASWLTSSKTLRTFLKNGCIQMSDVETIISKGSCLRVLYLQSILNIRKLPDTLGRLLHLRYLDLSNNYKLEMLPKSITKLHNLQTLILLRCNNLKELPEDTSKLVNLRVLDIYGCSSLNHMPAGMGKLTCLHTLEMFVLGREDDELNQDKIGKSIDLKALINNLRGTLYVGDHGSSYNNMLLFDCFDVHIKSIELECKLRSHHKEGQTSLLESLFYNHQIYETRVKKYAGTVLPSLASGLVSIKLVGCNELQYLQSSLSQLCHLKYLELDHLNKLEYIESNAPSSSAQLFFPSLEELILNKMPNLKGWWRDIRWTEKESVFIPSFPQLHKLTIYFCERLKYFPPCPHVKELNLFLVDEELTFCFRDQRVPFSLERLHIDEARIFNSLPREFIRSAVCIKLSTIELGTIREGIQSCSSSLRDLQISYCRGMENLGIEHLTNLKSLTLESNLEGIPWESLHSLSSLEIADQKVVILPKGIQYLTSLQSLILHDCCNLEELGECINYLTSLQLLQLYWCRKLKSLPEAMRRLSLTTLKIRLSPQLEGRCRKSDGEDWPNICHIPNLDIS